MRAQCAPQRSAHASSVVCAQPPVIRWAHAHSLHVLCAACCVLLHVLPCAAQQAFPAGRGARAAAHPVHRARVDERAERGVRVQAAAQLQLAHALGRRLHKRVVHAGLPRASEPGSGGRCGASAAPGMHADALASRPMYAHWGTHCDTRCVSFCTAAKSMFWARVRDVQSLQLCMHLGPGPAGRQLTAKVSAAHARHDRNCCQLARPHHDQMTATKHIKAQA